MAATNVLSVRDRLEVVWIDARRHSAKVVEFEAIPNRSVHPFPEHAVRLTATASAAGACRNCEASVAVVVVSGSPAPTPIGLLFDF